MKPSIPVKLPKPMGQTQNSLDEPINGLSSGLRALVARDFLHSVKHQEQHLRANREGAHEQILLFEKKFLAKMRKLGIPMFAHSVVRTNEEQTKLFVQGVTNAKAGQSPHNYGMAIDLVHGVKAWDLQPQSWTMIHHIGIEIANQNGIKIRSGYDWDQDGDLTDQRLPDPAHWELRDWKQIAGL